MKAPTVHVNGTGREELTRQQEAAGRALMAALRALDECAPNARDYYPQGDTAFADAMREHAARVAKVRSVLEEVQRLLDGLNDGEDG